MRRTTNVFWSKAEPTIGKKKKNQNYENDYSIFLLEIQDLAFSKSMIDILSYFGEKSGFFLTQNKVHSFVKKISN